MKATIRGVRYDTDKAILVGQHTHGKSGDLSYWMARLYRLPISGRYFLVGTGGAMTVFAGEARLLPFATHTAVDWAERYLEGAL
jgi:hypothetical protein